jgi:hypothetical protein
LVPFQVTVVGVPEPATWTVSLGLGLIALAKR